MAAKRTYEIPTVKKIEPTEAIAKLEEAAKKGDEQAAKMLEEIRKRHPESAA